MRPAAVMRRDRHHIQARVQIRMLLREEIPGACERGTPADITHMQARCRQEQRRQLAEMRARRGLPRPQSNGVQNIDARLRRTAGGKERHLPLRGAPPLRDVGVLAILRVENDRAAAPGEEGRNDGARALARASWPHQEDMRFPSIGQEPPLEAAGNDALVPDEADRAHFAEGRPAGRSMGRLASPAPAAEGMHASKGEGNPQGAEEEGLGMLLSEGAELHNDVERAHGVVSRRKSRCHHGRCGGTTGAPADLRETSSQVSEDPYSSSYVAGVG